MNALSNESIKILNQAGFDNCENLNDFDIQMLLNDIDIFVFAHSNFIEGEIYSLEECRMKVFIPRAFAIVNGEIKDLVFNCEMQNYYDALTTATEHAIEQFI